MKKQRVQVVLIAALFVLLVESCTSSKITEVWRDPAYTKSGLNNVLVIAIKKDQARRHVWEDAYVSELSKRGIQATASYQLFPKALPDTNDVRNIVKSAGFDGVIVTNQLDREIRKTYVPTTVQTVPITRYNRFYGSYYTVYRQIENPGYAELVSVLISELNVWEAEGDGQLIWAGISETPNPSSVGSLSDDLSKTFIPALVKDKIIR
jgi:hypothetical protein